MHRRLPRPSEKNARLSGGLFTNGLDLRTMACMLCFGVDMGKWLVEKKGGSDSDILQ